MGFDTIIGLLSFFNVCGFLANCSVLLIICRNRRVRKTLSYIFVINLTVADLFYCSFIFPLNLYFRSGGIFDDFLCRFWFMLSRITHLASVLSLLALNVDKFLYIAYALKYDIVAKKAYFFVSIFLIWSISTSWGVPTVTEESATNNVTVSSIVMANSSSSIVVGSKISHAKCKFKNNVMLDIVGPIIFYLVPTLICVVLSFIILKIVVRSRQRLNMYFLDNRISRKYGRKLCRAVCFVVVTTFLSASLILPYWIVYATNYFCHCVDKTFLFTVMVNFPAMNSVVNPFLTILTQKTYRAHVREWLNSASSALSFMKLNCLVHYLMIASRKISRSFSGSSSTSTSDQKKTLSTSAEDESCDWKINILVRDPNEILKRELSKRYRKAAVVDGCVFKNGIFDQPNSSDGSS